MEIEELVSQFNNPFHFLTLGPNTSIIVLTDLEIVTTLTGIGLLVSLSKIFPCVSHL